MEIAGGIEVDLGGEPTPPAGWEAVVSTAHLHRIDGIRRAEFLAELVAAQPAIVVGGAHGKTTTSAMIAFVLAETGRDPAWIIGGIVPQLGGNAGVGAGWLVVEGDESDRSIGSARSTDRGDHEHRARPPRGLRVGGRAARVLRSGGSKPSRRSFGAGSIPLSSSSSQCPGDHNRQNAAAALAALELAGVPRPEAEAAIVRFTGAGRRFELVGARGGRHGLRRLRPQPDRARGDVAYGEVAHERQGDRRLSAARRRAHAAASPRARGGPRARRRGDRDGHHRRPRCATRGGDGQARRRFAAAEVRAGWAPSLDDAASLALAWSRPGDLIITFGVGEPWKIARAIVDGLRR